MNRPYMAQWFDQAVGGGGQPSETVNTSKPESVTSRVCSYCADRLWSLVTTVQPSPSCLMPALPALIIGSMVKVMPASSSGRSLGGHNATPAVHHGNVDRCHARRTRAPRYSPAVRQSSEWHGRYHPDTCLLYTSPSP